MNCNLGLHFPAAPYVRGTSKVNSRRRSFTATVAGPLILVFGNSHLTRETRTRRALTNSILMPAKYHIAGSISVVFFLLCLVGIWLQLVTIWRRKHAFHSGDFDSASSSPPTAVLSLNQFYGSFLAFYSFLLYGICVEPFNHYLVWTRLFACVLVMMILYEIWHDRRTSLAALGVASGVVLMGIAAVALGLGNRAADEGRWIGTTLAMIAAAVFAQGLIHQIVRVRQSGHTGAISLRMHQLTTLKDMSTIGFALTMPSGTGWPLMTVGGVGVVTKSVLMWHFRWAHRSEVAAGRRHSSNAPSVG